MAISSSKQRYSVTLTPERVNRFQTVCNKLGLPSSTMSNVFNDTLTAVSETFEQALQKGSMEISDIFRVMGQQMQLLEEDNKLEGTKNAISRQKRNPLPGK